MQNKLSRSGERPIDRKNYRTTTTTGALFMAPPATLAMGTLESVAGRRSRVRP